MREELGHGSLDAWARDDLRISPDADYSIPDKEARKLLAQMAKGDVERPFLTLVAAYGDQMRGAFWRRI